MSDEEKNKWVWNGIVPQNYWDKYRVVMTEEKKLYGHTYLKLAFHPVRYNSRVMVVFGS